MCTPKIKKGKKMEWKSYWCVNDLFVLASKGHGSRTYSMYAIITNPCPYQALLINHGFIFFIFIFYEQFFNLKFVRKEHIKNQTISHYFSGPLPDALFFFLPRSPCSQNEMHAQPWAEPVPLSFIYSFVSSSPVRPVCHSRAP